MQTEQSHKVSQAFAAFFATSLDETLERCLHRDPRAAAIALFHDVAASVPAYRAFLAEHGVDPASIRDHDDLRRVPPVSKANYVLRHPLADLCRDGKLSACDMVAVSSGSTGKPTFWPRFVTDELVVARRFEQVFHDAFAADRRRTLAVVCFALGTWVGGMFTASCCRHLAAKGYPVTVVTPGNNKEEILRVTSELGPQFDQVVLLGYPPFLKDVIDFGLDRGVRWPDLKVRIVTAGEVFSEAWRTLVAERIGSRSPAHDFASLYGTADAGVLGVETPLSISVRRFLADRPEAARALFGQDRLPTLVQVDPFARYFEAVDGALVFTGDNGVPLVRYDILDTGGVVSFEAMLAAVEGLGFDARAALGRAPVRALPFVFVFGRSDFTVSFYGANVYPENVTVGLEQPAIAAFTTGKFVMMVERDADENEHLAVIVELALGHAPSEARAGEVASAIEAQLVRLNSEYRTYVPAERRTPKVTLAPAGDPTHFPAGVKHRYTKRPA
jgi:phenylacetate-CoA ligase